MSRINIKTHQNNTEITISPKIKIIFVLFSILMTLVFFGYSSFFFYAIQELDFPVYFVLFIIPFVWILYIYVSSFFKKEIIYIDNDRLILCRVLFGIKTTIIDLNRLEIIEVKYLGFDNFTTHQLETEHDSLGFGVAEKEVQFLSKKGSISLLTKNKEYRFGNDLFSEDADIIISKIKKTVPNNSYTK